MPEVDSPNLVTCDSLGEARELSARIRAGLPGREVGAGTSPTSRDLEGAVPSSKSPLTDVRGLSAPDLAGLHQRLDRLEQALASAGTFA